MRTSGTDANRTRNRNRQPKKIKIIKRYGPQVALNQLSLDIQAGMLCVLLGPNGAGESTLFQVLTGLFATHNGDAGLLGATTRKNAKSLD